MEGLEIQEKLLSAIRISPILRLEAEFYNSKQFSCKNVVSGKEAISFVQYGTSEELNENKKGYPTLRLNEYNSSFISVPAKYCNRIDKQTFETLKLKKNDVLICRTNGNPQFVGKSALVPKDYDYAFASYLFRVRPNTNYINSATLVSFLNSKYGRSEIEKYSMIGNQANFSPAKFKEIRIPVFSSNFQAKIEQLMLLSFEYLEKSIAAYQMAEEILNNLINIDISQQLTINIKNIQESYCLTGRLDAEYYQPKYDKLLEYISSFPSGYGTIESMFLIKEQNCKLEDNQLYKYIELSNIGIDGKIKGHTEAYGKELPSRARRIVRSGDLIISSLEGSLQSCALIPEKYDGAICSTGFYVLTPKEINAETALVLFKSPLMQALMTRLCSGTIMASMKIEEFVNLIIPKIDPNTQYIIADIIHNEVQQRDESIRLLELAKTVVEVAIEQGEDFASKLFDNQIKE